MHKKMTASPQTTIDQNFKTLQKTIVETVLESPLSPLSPSGEHFDFDAIPIYFFRLTSTSQNGETHYYLIQSGKQHADGIQRAIDQLKQKTLQQLPIIDLQNYEGNPFGDEFNDIETDLEKHQTTKRIPTAPCTFFTQLHEIGIAIIHCWEGSDRSRGLTQTWLHALHQQSNNKADTLSETNQKLFAKLEEKFPNLTITLYNYSKKEWVDYVPEKYIEDKTKHPWECTMHPQADFMPHSVSPSSVQSPTEQKTIQLSLPPKRKK